MPVSLSYDEYGSGPLLLILHGLMGQARNWATVAKMFAGEYRVLSVDLRNHGRSPWVSGPCTATGLAFLPLAVCCGSANAIAARRKDRKSTEHDTSAVPGSLSTG